MFGSISGAGGLTPLEEGKYKTTPIEVDYEVFWDKKLGTGINGDVVKCRKRATGESFALKCLRYKPEALREIALHVKCCRHPHIVKVYDVYDNELRRGPSDIQPTSRKLLMVMELMQGGELFDRIMEKKVFTEKEASNVMYQVISAVHFMHENNIAHRDLKPENLLYKSKDPDAPLKLADFGFAKVDQGNLVTPVYTPSYVSGEILEAARVQRAKRAGALPSSHVFAYDKSCDIWSLGVILYIVLSGYPPFQSEVPGSALSEKMKKNIKEGHYVFHPKYWSHISNEAKDLVSRMLSPNPATRITAAEIMEYPWVVGDNVKETQLLTPTAMSEDPAQLAATVQQWDEELTQMRRDEMQLKPLANVNNRLIQKRMARTNSGASLQVPSSSSSSSSSHPGSAAGGGSVSAASAAAAAAAAAAPRAAPAAPAAPAAGPVANPLTAAAAVTASSASVSASAMTPTATSTAASSAANTAAGSAAGDMSCGVSTSSLVPMVVCTSTGGSAATTPTPQQAGMEQRLGSMQLDEAQSGAQSSASDASGASGASVVRMVDV